LHSRLMSRAADPWAHPDRVVDEGLHASRRASIWDAAPKKGSVVGNTPNKRVVHESWANGLRDSSAFSNGRGAARARSPARRATPDAGKQGEGRLVVESRGGAGSRADSPARRGASPKPSSRRKPRLVEVVDPNGTSATEGTARPEWQVPSFKADIGRIHVSQREKLTTNMRAMRDFE